MKELFSIGVRVWAVVIPIIATIGKWVSDNKDKINAVVLRIQKDSESHKEWSKEEKEQLVIDLFFQEIYIKFPWYLKTLGKKFWETKVRKIIVRFCGKSHILKK